MFLFKALRVCGTAMAHSPRPLKWDTRREILPHLVGTPEASPQHSSKLATLKLMKLHLQGPSHTHTLFKAPAKAGVICRNNLQSYCSFVKEKQLKHFPKYNNEVK